MQLSVPANYGLARLRLPAKPARMQGMMAPMKERPIRIDAAKIPADFLERIERAGCTQRDCADCGICGQVAGEAVTIDKAFRDHVPAGYGEAEESILTGRLWDV
jgi:hypothetical protein